jgi:uncharacterized repeat protein (TIGR03943 family)
VDERTQGAMMLAIGGVAVRLGLTDASLAYVKPGLRPLLTVAGLVLVVLGAAGVLRAFRDEPVPPPVPDPEDDARLEAAGAAHAHAAVGHSDDGHGHGVSGPRVAWLLTLPLLAVLLVAPPPLGAFAAGRQSGRVVATTERSYPPLPTAVDGAVPLGLVEFQFRALYDETRSMEGQRVRLVGFASPVPGDAGGDYLLTRFIVNCCAADGTAVTVEIHGDPVPRAPDTWLEIEGTWEPRPGQEPGKPTPAPPVVVAESVTPIPQPDEPYEY